MKSRRPKGRRLHWAVEYDSTATLCGSWGAPHLAPSIERVSCLSCRRSLNARQEDRSHDVPEGAA